MRSNLRQQVASWAASELRPATLAASLLASLMVYVLEIIMVVSFAALLFSGGLASQLPQALGFLLLGDAILIVAVALLSSYPGSISAVQDTPGVVLAVVAAAIVALPIALPQQYATVLMMLVLTTGLIGLLFILLGLFKLGGLARFLPYPVMGGFLAGTGWLLAQGGVSVMTGAPMGMGWLSGPALIQWAPGAALGLIILVAEARLRRPATLPIGLILGGALFYVVAGALGRSPAQLRAAGWLIEAVQTHAVASFPLSPAVVSQVDWAALQRQLPNLLPVALIGVIALLLNSSSLELLSKRDLDLNRELIAAGIANLCAGLFGGLVGYHAISLTALNQRLSGGRRLVGILAGLMVAATLLFGLSAIAYVPKLVLGAVLVYLGAGLLYEWVYAAWFKFPRIDFAIIVAILGVVIFSGFLSGVLVGLVMAVILFVISYSQISVIRHAFTGHEYRSRVTRLPQERQTIERHGDQIYILKLEGFIFFGTASKILSQVGDHIRARAGGEVKYVLLDFAKVSGMDSTGMLSFLRLVQWAREQRLALVFTGLQGRARDQIFREPALGEGSAVRLFADLDRGLEWCENQLLAEHLPAQAKTTAIAAYFQAILHDAGSDILLPYFQRRTYRAGKYLMRQGDESSCLYFIESGVVTAQIETPGKRPVRLETMEGGRTVGELGFYLGTLRTASVICDEDTVVYSLSIDDLRHMEAEEPEAASMLHRITVFLLSERVTHLTRTVDALERS